MSTVDNCHAVSCRRKYMSVIQLREVKHSITSTIVGFENWTAMSLGNTCCKSLALESDT